jgi:hypothetical protein
MVHIVLIQTLKNLDIIISSINLLLFENVMDLSEFHYLHPLQRGYLTVFMICISLYPLLKTDNYKFLITHDIIYYQTRYTEIIDNSLLHISLKTNLINVMNKKYDDINSYDILLNVKIEYLDFLLYLLKKKYIPELILKYNC